MPKTSRQIFISWALLIGIALIAAAALFSPNPYGENPDAIADESYFVTSLLSAIQHHRLPGWDWVESGAYYGGVQTYLLLATATPLLIILRIIYGPDGGGLWVATHIGSITHIARLTSALVWWLLIVGAGYMLCFKKISQRYWWSFGALVGILFSSSIFVGTLHTAKIWNVAMAIDVLIIVLVWYAEQERVHTGNLPWSKKRYSQILLWLIFLAFIQSYTGGIAGVWLFYAWFLGQIKPKEIWLAVRWHVLVMLIIFAATQWTIFYRFINTFRQLPGTITNATASAAITPGGSYDLINRLVWPFKILFLSQPVLFILIPIILGWIIFNWKTETKYRRLFLVLIANPIIYYAFFYLFLGFGRFVRYGIMLAVTASLSAALLLPRRPWTKILLGVIGVWSVFLTGKIATLYWRPAAEIDLQKYITTHANKSNQVFVLHSDRTYLPFNPASLTKLSNRQLAMGRFQFISRHTSLLPTGFQPTVIYAEYETPESLATKLKTISVPGNTVWSVTNDCSICKPAATCVNFNIAACTLQDELPQEITTLRDVLASQQLGRPIKLEIIQ